MPGGDMRSRSKAANEAARGVVARDAQCPTDGCGALIPMGAFPTVGFIAVRDTTDELGRAIELCSWRCVSLHAIGRELFADGVPVSGARPEAPDPEPAPVAPPKPRPARTTKTPTEAQKARAWAIAHGHPVPVRGRLSDRVLAAYANAGGDPVTPPRASITNDPAPMRCPSCDGPIDPQTGECRCSD